MAAAKKNTFSFLMAQSFRQRSDVDSVAQKVARSHEDIQTQAKTINVVLFGEANVGKSSVIDLIARKNIAKILLDVKDHTMQSTPYAISFDGIDFTIFDTTGLEEPHIRVNDCLKAIEGAYELVIKLGDAGGIHLLLFCMRGGRMTTTTQNNYRLFCEYLCDSNVPVALVFTGLEREIKPEDWWLRNKQYVEDYGIKSTGHACVTTVKGEELEGDANFDESQVIIRSLLKECALRRDAYRMETRTWLVQVGRGLLGFIEKAKTPKGRDITKVLTTHCGMDPETAKKVTDMMRSRNYRKEDGGADTAVQKTDD